LPKAVLGLSKNPRLFADETQAMVDLGVGKNMVRSIRFWALAAGVAESTKSGECVLTKFGRALLGPKGHDRFLEDVRTLWLIHWKLSSSIENPLLAWDYLLNRWLEPELVPSAVSKVLQREIDSVSDKVSPATLEQHLTAFFHSYVPTRGRKGEVQEDNLDCPLVELDFIVKVGDREIERSSGKREPIYTYRREEKPDVTPEVFLYCLNDFWDRRHRSEATISLRDVAHGHGSPGQIFKLPEEDIRQRLEGLEQETHGFLTYMESASLQRVRRQGERDTLDLLKAVYSTECRP
jgi:hypothetical protein